MRATFHLKLEDRLQYLGSCSISQIENFLAQLACEGYRMMEIRMEIHHAEQQ